MAHDFEKKWRSADVRLQENVDFSVLLLSDRLLAGLTEAGFKKPSPIQLEAIPMGRFGKDLLVQAKSGTGKTLVFVIVALEMLKRKLFRPQVLVLVPTREIATQICSVMKLVGSTFPKLICNSFIGGMPLADDREKALMSQIVVGTPGRVKQLIQMQALPTNSVRLFVLDEADQLLEASFKDDISEIFNLLPEDKQVIATSATYPPKLKQMMMKYLRDPHVACLSEKQIALLGMVHYVKVVEFCPMPVLQYKSKLAALEDILKNVKFSQCLLFCNGVLKVEVLYKDIKKWGFSTAYISSAKEQTDRLKAIDRLKHFKCKVLVSSDLTARGIDAENVDLVINFDVSPVYETYMHRVGRAGRYGSVGVAITIIDEKEIKCIQKIEQAGGFKSYKLPDPVPVYLVLHPSKGEYVIPEEVKNIDNFENGEKSSIPNDKIKNGIEITSTSNVNMKNVELDNVSNANTEINVDITSKLLPECIISVKEFGSSDKSKIDKNFPVTGIESNVLHAVKNNFNAEDVELEFISCENGEDSANFMCKPELECTSKTKTSNSVTECTFLRSDIQQDSAGNINGITSNDENHKMIDVSEEKTEITFSEVESKNKMNIFANLIENKSSNFPSDCNDIRVIHNNTSPDKISDKNLAELCSNDLQASPENQNLTNKAVNIEVASKLTSNFKSNDFEKAEFKSFNEEISMISTDHVSQLSETKDSNTPVNTTDVNLSSKEENDVGLAQKLNYYIETFVDNYEANKNTGSTDSKNTNEMYADSGKKVISVDIIKDLNIRKNEYFYKLFKKYQNKNIISCSEGDTEENVEVLGKFSQTEVVEDNSVPVVFCEESSAGLIPSIESSEVEANSCPGKPNYESTPQHTNKTKLQIIKTVVSESKIKMENQNKLLQLFQESSDESDSSDSKLSENVNSSFNGSGSSSDSSDSKCDSSSNSESSSISASSEDETNGSVIEQSHRGHLTNPRNQSQSRGESHRVAYRNTDKDQHHRGYPMPYTCTSYRNQVLASGGSCSVDYGNTGKYQYQRENSMPYTHKCQSLNIANQKIAAARSPQKPSKHIKHKCSDYHHYCNKANSHPLQLPGSQYCLQSVPQFPALPACMNKEMHSIPRSCANKYQNLTGQAASSHFQAGRSCSSAHRNKDHYLREHPQSDCRHSNHHTLNCYLPEHRCHPNTSDYACNHGQICAMWYEEFYKQWLYIQNIIN